MKWLQVSINVTRKQQFLSLFSLFLSMLIAACNKTSSQPASPSKDSEVILDPSASIMTPSQVNTNAVGANKNFNPSQNDLNSKSDKTETLSLKDLPPALFSTEGKISQIVSQRDGKILLAGWFRIGKSFGIARIHQDGSLDKEFQTHVGYGIEDYDSRYEKFFGPPENSASPKIILQPDQKILISTSSRHFNRKRVPQGLIRLHTNGSLDTAFNSSHSDLEHAPLNATLTDDGKVLVTGHIRKFYMILSSGSHDKAYEANFSRFVSQNEVDSFLHTTFVSGKGILLHYKNHIGDHLHQAAFIDAQGHVQKLNRETFHWDYNFRTRPEMFGQIAVDSQERILTFTKGDAVPFRYRQKMEWDQEFWERHRRELSVGSANSPMSWGASYALKNDDSFLVGTEGRLSYAPNLSPDFASLIHVHENGALDDHFVVPRIYAGGLPISVPAVEVEEGLTTSVFVLTIGDKESHIYRIDSTTGNFVN